MSTVVQRAGRLELLQLQDQGFAPNNNLIDGAKGLPVGYEAALPSVYSCLITSILIKMLTIYCDTLKISVIAC